MSTKLLWAVKSYSLCMCSVVSIKMETISRPWYCGTEGRSKEHVGRYKVMTETVMAQRPAPKPPSRNSRQCLPPATDPTEIPLTSPFYCHAINALLFLHKQRCHTDDPTVDPQAPAWPNHCLGHSGIGWVHERLQVPMSVELTIPFPLYFPICNNTLLVMCCFLLPYTT